MDIIEEFSVDLFDIDGKQLDKFRWFPTYQSAVEEAMEEANRNENIYSFSVNKVFKVTR